MYQKSVCEGGYGALNCKNSKSEYLGVTSEPRMSSMAGKTLNHISYFKYLGSKILILERAKYVKFSLGQSVGTICRSSLL